MSKTTIENLQESVNFMKSEGMSVGELSDGYHTFNELYHHRAMLFASLCLTSLKHCAWKSLLHNDPNEPMYSGMFIVGIETPYGQATYHYDIDPYWSIFKGIKELDRAPKFDGHTPAEAIDRIYKYCSEYLQKPHKRTISIGQDIAIDPRDDSFKWNPGPTGTVRTPFGNSTGTEIPTATLTTSNSEFSKTRGIPPRDE